MTRFAAIVGTLLIFGAGYSAGLGDWRAAAGCLIAATGCLVVGWLEIEPDPGFPMFDLWERERTDPVEAALAEIRGLPETWERVA